MTCDTPKFRAEWFRDQEKKLETASADLDRIGQKLGAVQYDFSDSYRFLPFKPALQTMQISLTSGPGDADEGVEFIDALRDAMVETARSYLRAEASNEGLSKEIETLIASLDL